MQLESTDFVNTNNDGTGQISMQSWGSRELHS
jgi:hypothetical protein